MRHSFHPALLALASHRLKGALRQMPAQPLSDDEWAPFLDDVRRHRLTGLLADATKGGEFPVTSSQQQEGDDAHIASMTHVLMLENFLIDSVELLGRAGIQVRVLKGSAVAHLDYADAALRPFVDVDLLVRSEQFDLATETLREHGYQRYFAEIRPGYDRRFGKGVSFVSPGNLELDLHRTFAMGPFGLRVNLDDLWSSGQDFTLAGTPLSGLGPDERLLHACYHASLGDYPPRLLPLRDVAEMLLYGERDEQHILELSRAWGGEAVVARAVAMAWELFDIADVTAMSAWAARYRPAKRDKGRLAVYTDGDTSYAAKSLASLTALPRIRDRVALLRMVAAPDPGFLSRRHRSRASWLIAGFKRATRRSEDHR